MVDRRNNLKGNSEHLHWQAKNRRTSSLAFQRRRPWGYRPERMRCEPVVLCPFTTLLAVFSAPFTAGRALPSHSSHTEQPTRGRLSILNPPSSGKSPGLQKHAGAGPGHVHNEAKPLCKTSLTSSVKMIWLLWNLVDLLKYYYCTCNIVFAISKDETLRDLKGAIFDSQN